ncbi:hypothetical protein FisN_8Hh267 [Fistulifera solaris]|uniref:Uncharacterized protein n=1 Tax=Fistulifera solaris TaxID=1519565 RepID=A0A1Z5JYD4_FISSO|nr:hypothetical protein FisN_8Hh267 [Fistulifera solaris]|eukprot:GAX19043.1 hypothetical protein FisN_8Hh267 [Fistulifera solaris]
MGGPFKFNICTYGPLHILTVLSSIAATALTYYATFDCHFLETTTPLEAFANLDAEFGFRRGVGVWTLEVDGKCQGWSSDEELDIPTVVARVFTMVVCIFSLMLLIMLMVPCCSMVGGTAYMQKLGQFLLIMGVLYPLSFTILKADICTGVSVCKLDYTGYVSLGASATWVLASCLAFLVRAKPVERKSGRRKLRNPPLPTVEGSLQGTTDERTKFHEQEENRATDP